MLFPVFDVKKKVFRDSIHGYIQIPEIIVGQIIDTELFQRLRNIEQTSMRSLYPAARHDRFIHSLGVYFLGVQAFRNFRSNVSIKHIDFIDKYQLDDDWWKENCMLFSLACLLHDCAHAPFSHTLEFIYDVPLADKDDIDNLFKDTEFEDKIDSLTKLNFEVLNTYNSDEFMHDYLNDTISEVKKGVGAPHEKLSAIMVKREYKDAARFF